MKINFKNTFEQHLSVLTWFCVGTHSGTYFNSRVLYGRSLEIPGMAEIIFVKLVDGTKCMNAVITCAVFNSISLMFRCLYNILL